MFLELRGLPKLLAFPEGVASHQSGLSKGVPLYNGLINQSLLFDLLAERVLVMASFDGQSFSLEPEESGRVITKLNELIEHAENLVKQCDELKHIKGIAKFKKRCLAELNFVQQVRQDL